jgi:hypothetical protein
MNKKIKITLAVLAAATAIIIIVPLGISKFPQQEEVTKEGYTLGTIRGYVDGQKADSDTKDGVSLGDLDVKIEHQTGLSADEVMVEPIEEDSETGAVTGYVIDDVSDAFDENKEDKDIVIVNDRSLEEAQKSETVAKEILDSVLDSIIDNDSGTETVEEAKKEKEIEQVKKDNVGKNDSNTTDGIDQVTIDIFAEQGWDINTDHSLGNIPEDAVWDIQNPERNYSGVFTTP